MNLSRRLPPFLLIFLLLPTLVLADPRSGPYLAGGLMLDAATAADYNGEAVDGSAVDTRISAGNSRTGGTLAAGYQFAPGSQFVLMVEAGKDFSTDQRLSTNTRFTTQFVGYDEVTRRWELQRDWYVALKPGWQLTPATTLYLSIAYHRGSARLEKEFLSCPGGSCTSTTYAPQERRTSGTGIGLGLQSALSEHWFLRAEVERINVRRVEFIQGDPGNISDFYVRERLDADNTVGRLMLGWRF